MTAPDRQRDGGLGLSLHPWQARTVEMVMSQEPDGTWTHKRFHLVAPRHRPEPCIIRPDRPHVCVRPDHAGLHGTPRQETQ